MQGSASRWREKLHTIRVAASGAAGEFQRRRGSRMKKRLWRNAALICVLAAFGAKAEEKAKGQFGWFGVGKTYEIDKGHYYWVGEFTGTFFNDKGEGAMFHKAGVKCPAFYEIDANGKTNGGGYCVITDKDGDQAFCQWKNSGTSDYGPGTFQFVGGTGKYSGLKGDNTFVGVTQVFWKDGTSTGYAIWNR
jgi:hypothetical protein